MANRKMRKYQGGGVVRQVAGPPSKSIINVPVSPGPKTIRLTQAEAAKRKAGQAEKVKYSKCAGKSGQDRVNCVKDVYGITVIKGGTKITE